MVFHDSKIPRANGSNSSYRKKFTHRNVEPSKERFFNYGLKQKRKNNPKQQNWFNCICGKELASLRFLRVHNNMLKLRPKCFETDKELKEYFMVHYKVYLEHLEQKWAKDKTKIDFQEILDILLKK